jgi:hypothetical protein
MMKIVESSERMELYLRIPFLSHIYGVMLNELRTETILPSIVSQSIPLESERQSRQNAHFTSADTNDISQV